MTDTTLNDLSLTISRHIAAPRTRVFDAWLDPEMLARFMRPTETIRGTDITTDPRTGGRFAINMRGDQDYPHSGTYLEITRPERLVFTWEGPHSVEGTTVTLTFAEADGGTLVELTQVRFANEDSRDGHKFGWTNILAALAETA